MGPRLAARRPESTDDSEFRSWYADRARRLGLNPNPDDPRHHYDYRAAFAAGAEPDEAGHWPSQFKDDTHPNRFIGGVDTRKYDPSDPDSRFGVPMGARYRFGEE